MSIRSVFRGAAVKGYATPTNAPLRVDSATNTLKLIVAGSGTTEIEQVDVSTAQTLTNKTLTAPTVTSPILTSPVITGGSKVDAPIASSSATVVLTAAMSGQTFLMDRAGGTQYTLPAPVVGLNFKFLNSVLQTGGANVVVTDAGTTFVTGSVIAFSGENVTPSSTLGPKQFAGNGSTHIKVTTNATTTGGGIGTELKFVCISSTIWYVTGVVNSPSGSLATPFST